MNFSFHPEAETELQEATEYYESQRTGLGLDFAAEINWTIQNILEFPSAWPIFEGNLRRCLVPRFPYGILYEADGGLVHVIAVMHLHRNPRYWIHRNT